MPHDDMITIHADILQVTDAAVLIACEGEEVWLPLSQIDFDGERGDMNVSISLPKWLADEKGLSDGGGMTRATVTDLRTGLPKRKDDGKTCRNCVFSVLADDENEPLPFECAECTRSGLATGTKDNWTDNGEEPDIPGDPPDTTRVTLTIISFSEDGETAQVKDRHGNQWELSTLDFTHDADDLNVGDTLLCYVLKSAAIIWLDHDNGTEMKRRPMTAEERQYRLPIPRPGDGASTPPSDPAGEQTAPAPVGETISTAHATNRHTCLDCGHMLDSEDGRQAEECASCSQSGSGEADNWTPRQECRTCSHSHTTIDLPPCKGCALNVMPEHRGDEERWEWADATNENADVSGTASDAGSTDNAPGATEQEAHASV